MVATIGLIVAGAPPAAAATPCGGTDPYARQTLTPASAGAALAADARFGATVATGDFNKDGFADVAVGAPTDVVGGAASGSVYVFPGSASGVGAGRRLLQTAAGAADEAGDRFGAALAAGDFNNDGYADLAIGVPGELVGDIKSGGIAVFHGKAAGLTTGTSLTQAALGWGNEAGDEFGYALAAGDFNRDGYADLAVGAPGEGPNGESVRGGDVGVFKGASGGLTAGWGVHQSDLGAANEAGDRFGAALAAGNVTGSAHTDLIIGSPGENSASGLVAVMPGAADGTGTGFNRTQTNNGGSNEANDNLGAALAVGDFDKDGFADIAAGVPGEAPGSDPAGGSLLVFPGASAQLGTGYWLQQAEGGEPLTAGDRFGSAVAAGDADRDGHADLLVGAPNKSYTGASRSGVAFLFKGRVKDTGGTRALSPARRIAQHDVGDAAEGSDTLASGLGFGDVNGDGRADAVVGAAGEAPSGQPRSGAVVVLRNAVPPSAGGLPIAQFSPTEAMQASPATGATLGMLEYAYSDNIGRLMHGHQADPDSTLSVQWTPIHGTAAFTGRPALAEQADGRLQVVALETSGNLSVRTQQTKGQPTWGSWVSLGGPVAAPPAAARQADGTLAVFAVDGAGALWALRQRAANSEYTAWLGLGVGGLTGSPVAVPVSTGVRLFVRDAAGIARTMVYAGGAVSGCTALGDAAITGAPAVVTYPGGRLRLFARAADGAILTMAQDGAGNFPATWSPVGTFTAAGPPAALIDPISGKTHVVARGADGGIYGTRETVQGSGEWTDWAQWNAAGDNAATDPTVFSFSNSNGSTWAFVYRTIDNASRVYQPVLSLSADGARAFRASP